MPTVYWYRIATARPVCAEYTTGAEVVTMSRRSSIGRKETQMPTGDDLERRLWRTMPWDAEVMWPSAEQDEKDEQEGEDE